LQRSHRAPGRFALQCSARDLDELLEALEIELAWFQVDAIGGPAALDPLSPQRSPEAVDIHVQRADRRLGWPLVPKRLDQLFARSEAPAAQQQRRQQCALLGLTQGERRPVAEHLKRSEESELHKSLSSRS
jgi:hypothetical protein